jgi:hypothetical protein
VLTGDPAQQLRVGGLQHGVDGGVSRASQFPNGPGGLGGEGELLDASQTLFQPVLRADQGGRVEAVEQLGPGGSAGFVVTLGQPGDEVAIGDRRGQPLAVVAGEDLTEQDRHRPAVQHDVVIRQDESVFVGRDANEKRAERRSVAQLAHRGALGRADPLDLVSGVGSAVQLDVMPARRRVSRNHLHRLAELLLEAGREVRVPGDHGMHRIAQTNFVEPAGEADVQLPGVEIVATPHGVGVKEQALLHRCQR